MPWTSAPFSLLIAAPSSRAQSLYRSLNGDARLSVTGLATTPEDLTTLLAQKPDGLLLDGLLFDGPDAMQAALAVYQGQTVIALPSGVDASAVADLNQLPSVVQIVQGDSDAHSLVAPLLPPGSSAASVSPVSPDTPVPHPPTPLTPLIPLPPPTGWQCIAVWSLQGGSGRSTVATALGLEAASRGMGTLLVGLGAPDPIPLSLGLQPEPTLAGWSRTPTLESLNQRVQSVHGLDVLAGFPSPLALTDYLPRSLEGEGSLPDLATTAAQAGYGVLLLDGSSPELAGAALAAANSLLLLTLPTLPGLLATVEAVRLTHETLAPRHRIDPARIHLLLNRARPSGLAPEQVVKSGRSLSPHFPDLTAVLADDPTLDEHLNAQQPAYFHSDPLRQAVRTLGNTLFGAKAGVVQPVAKEGKVYQLGPIRVRV